MQHLEIEFPEPETFNVYEWLLDVTDVVYNGQGLITSALVFNRILRIRQTKLEV